MGKELFTGKSKNNILGFNVRMKIIGGDRTTPLLAEESNVAGYAIYDEENAFSEKNNFSNFLDLKITYRTNKRRFSGTWALQINNVLRTSQNRQYVYNYGNQQVEMHRDSFTLPSLSYKIDF